MIFPTSGPPQLWSAIALGLAIVGCVAALQGWAAIARERAKILRAQLALTADEAWEGVLVTDEIKLSKWLRTRGIDADSCIADFIRACWSAWLGGRTTSLTELHVLVARRERARGSARLSAGIAGLLLVVGIVGTLSSVHPVLKAFHIPDLASGELEVSENTNLVNSLINDLGDAFWPSLIALGGTVAVVFFRGCYALGLHQFTLQLDRFAISTLIPRFRPNSITQEYTEVKRILSELSDDITKREESFGTVVTELQNLVAGITPAVVGLKATAKQSDEAAKNLSARSQSIADGITRNLGSKSPIYKAVSGFEGLFDRTTQAIDTLTSEVSSIGEKNREDRENLLEVVRELSKKVDTIGADHTAHKEQVENLLGQLRVGISNAPETIATAAEEAVSQGLQLVQSSIDNFRKENKEEGERFTEEVRKHTTAKMEEISKIASEKLEEIASTSAEIPKTAQELKALIITKSEVEAAAVAAIKKQQAETEMALAKPFEDLKKFASDLETTRKSLMDATESATSAFEQATKSARDYSPSQISGSSPVRASLGEPSPVGNRPSGLRKSGDNWQYVSGETGDQPESDPMIPIEDTPEPEPEPSTKSWRKRFFGFGSKK